MYVIYLEDTCNDPSQVLMFVRNENKKVLLSSMMPKEIAEYFLNLHQANLVDNVNRMLHAMHSALDVDHTKDFSGRPLVDIPGGGISLPPAPERHSHLNGGVYRVPLLGEKYLMGDGRVATVRPNEYHTHPRWIIVPDHSNQG